MTRPDWQQEVDKAQEVDEYTIGNKDYPRIRYGNEKRGGIKWHMRDDGSTHPCHDCAVDVGQYHVPGCDVEECPKCGGQSISCDCDDRE